MKLLYDRRGGSLVEYILLCGLCALLALGAIKKFGANVDSVTEDEADHVASLEGWQPNVGNDKLPKVGGGEKPSPPKKDAEDDDRKLSLKLAKELVQKGGSGTQDDVDIVVAELAKLPPFVLQLAKDNKVKVVACRNSVTDYAAELKGVKPRGWPPGSSWDTVPGFQRSKDGFHEVVIATVDAPGKKRAISGAHGSCSLVLHEFGHAMDEVVNDETKTKGSLYDDFKAARDRDAASLGDYYKQPGEAGLSEAYAESFAAYYSRKPGFAKDWPGMAKFWEKPFQSVIDARKQKK